MNCSHGLRPHGFCEAPLCFSTCLPDRRSHWLSLVLQLAAKKEGYSDVVYLDAKTDT